MFKILKKILPENFIWFLSNKKEEFKIIKAQVLKSNIITISLSLALNRQYINEHKAFLNGAFLYESSKRNNEINLFFLRRNIHRIEKGLLMIPRRDVFALRFILQTVKSYETLQKDLKDKRSEIEWAFKVLTLYFNEVNSDHKNFLTAQSTFLKLSQPKLQNKKMVPYNFDSIIPMEYEDISKICQYRKSVRWFNEKLVERTKIEKALKIAAMSPSSCNRSPFRYVFSLEDKKLTSQIAKVSSGTSGWADNIPAIAVLVGQQHSFSNLSNRHSIYVDSTLSVMPFILALETLGLSSCIINWADVPINEKKMANLISTKSDEKVILSIAIGYKKTDSLVAYSQKRYVNEISNFI